MKKRVTREELERMIENNEDVTRLDVSGITDMRWMFCGARTFNQDLSSWDVSNVTDMYRMFYGARTFNQDISGWDVSNVTYMSCMFEGARTFNQDLSSWDVSNVTYMSCMFENCPLGKSGIYEWKDGTVLIDGLISKVKKRLNNTLLLEDRSGEVHYAVTDGQGTWSHGKSAESARRDLLFKLSNRDKSVYESLTVDSEMSLDDAVVCYRTITGACSLGVEKFLEDPSRVKETYKISEILKLTEGQYGSQQFQQFFGK